MPHPNVTGSKCASDKVLLSIEEFMSGYGYGRTSTYELLNEEKIEAVKDGRRTKIVRASADAYVATLPRYEARQAA
jgi:hypothetical protein